MLAFYITSVTVAYLVIGWAIAIYKVATAKIAYKNDDHRYNVEKPNVGEITAMWTFAWLFVGIFHVVAFPFIVLGALHEKLVDHMSTMLTTRKERVWVEEPVQPPNYREAPQKAGHWETRRVPKNGPRASA